MDWITDVKNRWGAGWDAFAAEAERRYAGVLDDWNRYKGPVTQVVEGLIETRDALKRIERKIIVYAEAGGTDWPVFQKNWRTMLQDWNVLSAGTFDGSSRPDGAPVFTGDDENEVGAAWLVPIAGIILAVAGVCFAIACYEYAMSLRDNARAQEKEIDARTEAMRSGKKLQDSTYQQPDPPKPPDFDIGTTALVVGGLAAVGLIGWLYTRNFAA